MPYPSVFANSDFFGSFVDYTVTGICIFEYDESIQDFRFALCNKAFYQHNSFIINQDITGKPYKTTLPISLENGMYNKVETVYRTGKPIEFTLSYVNRQRGQVCQLFQMFKIGDKYVASMFNDISEMKHSEEQIRLEKVKYSQTLNSLAYGIVTTGPDKRITLVNRHACNILELASPEAVEGMHIEELYTVEKNQSNKLLNEMVEGFDVQTIVCTNGVKKLVAHRIAPLFDNEGKRHGFVYSFDDISDYVKAQEDMMFLNYHDTNTKFYNRSFLKIFMANNNTQSGLGIVYADINGLGRVNDQLGSNAGDDVLLACAEAFRNNLPENSIFVRFGEDDFIAVVFMAQDMDLTRAAVSIREEFEKACSYASTTLSVGTSVVGGDAKDLRDAIRQAQSKMNAQKTMSMQSIRSSALQSLLATLEVKSHETEEHAQRLNSLALHFVDKLQLNETQLNHLALLSVLHDIGKIGVPEFVLNKPAKLTEDEWKIMKNHTLLGYKILTATPELVDIAPLVRAHHERWDGKGYPDGLQGEEIPLLSRIISLVDSYDAMTNDRVYRSALTREEVLAELQKGRGTQFDPDLLEVFLQSLEEEDKKNRPAIIG